MPEYDKGGGYGRNSIKCDWMNDYNKGDNGRNSIEYDWMDRYDKGKGAR